MKAAALEQAGRRAEARTAYEQTRAFLSELVESA